MRILRNNLLDYIDEVYKIHQEKLGESYLSKEYFIDQVNNDRLFIALDNDVVVGYLIFDLVSEKKFFESKHVLDYGSDDTVLCLLTMAVKEEKNGVGTFLTNSCIDEYEKEVKMIYSPVWKSRLGTNAHKLLSNIGFRIIKEIDNYWYDDSIGKDEYCPVCGSPCVCTMVIYGMESSTL